MYYIYNDIGDVARDMKKPPFNFLKAFKRIPEGESYYKSVILNAFSIPLPSGEKFFINTLNRCIPYISSSQLTEQVRIFKVQEALHRKNHIQYNEMLCQNMGYKLDKLESPFLFNSDYVTKHKSLQYCLALTVCLEHITATAAEVILSNRSLFDAATREVAQFWEWHAIEELDHRSVAHDVYCDIYMDKLFLSKIMREVYPKFTRFLESTVLTMIAFDGYRVSEFKKWAGKSDFMVGENGVILHFKNYIDLFQRHDFDPLTCFNNDSIVSCLSKRFNQ